MRYRDPLDNSVCYLDFWAMLHTEVLLHREIPQFAGLYERASAQMIGIDGPQLDALRQYAQNARVPAPKPARALRPTAVRPAAAARWRRPGRGQPDGAARRQGRRRRRRGPARDDDGAAQGRRLLPRSSGRRTRARAR